MCTRDKLLVALAQPVGTRLSGEKLARNLGISRTMVWKHMRALRNEGLPVEGSARLGYRIAGPIDSSLQNWVRTGARNSWIVPHYFLSTASTQALAKAGADAGLPEGHLWIAEKQTSGRGRRDRPWNSAYGGLWISLLLRPPAPPVQAPSIAQVAAISLSRVIRAQTKLEARLKWPNDVVFKTPQGWRKLAGFLTEMSAEADRVHWIVIGMGLNVNNDLPAELRAIGASLSALAGRSFRRSDLLRAFLGDFRSAYRRWIQEGFEPFRKEYWKLYRDPEETVRLQTSRGLIAGAACGVDASGGLILKSHRQMAHLQEGEIVS